MHVFDYLVDVLSRLFRFHSYSPREKAYAALLFLAGLSLRDVSERHGFTDASRESVRGWVHRLRRAFNPMRKLGRLGERVYLWSAVDMDSGETLGVYASKCRSILNALVLLGRVLDACEGKPITVVDGGPWEPWALKRLGVEYFQETFRNRNKIERWFRKLKDRNRRFYNNIKTVKNIEGIATAITIIHNLLQKTKTEGGLILG